MAIVINIDVMLAKRKMSVTELSERVGITIANISILKNGKAKAIRLSTLEAICKALECQPVMLECLRHYCIDINQHIHEISVNDNIQQII